MVAVVLLVIMTAMYHYPAGATFGLSFLIVGLSYIVGNMGILRVSNNTIATIADLGLTTIAIWLIGPLVYAFSIAFISALVIGVGEWFFHKFVAAGILRQEEPSPQA